MAEFVFARRFLREVANWDKSASPRDREALERVLSRIAADPALPGRVSSFYDPQRPSYLYRAGSLLIHYRVTDAKEVEFLNLFPPLRPGAQGPLLCFIVRLSILRD